MKTILVPTDYSALSINALDIAMQLAKQNKASIILLHMVEFPIPSLATADAAFPAAATYHDTDYYQSMMDEAQDRLTKLASQSKYKSVKITPIASNNFEGLSHTIAQQKADLVVMASTGARGWKEMLLGSNAENVVRRASCPVLVVKKPIKRLRLKKILFATDFKNTAFVQKAAKLLELADTEPYFVCVNTPLNFNSSKLINRQMEKLAKKLNLQNYAFIIYNAFSEEEGILEYAEMIDADLIVMPTHGRKGLNHLLYGSIAEDVVNHAHRPVMTMME